MGFQHNGNGYRPQINGVEANEVQHNGTTIWSAVPDGPVFEDFENGISNYWENTNNWTTTTNWAASGSASGMAPDNYILSATESDLNANFGPGNDQFVAEFYNSGGETCGIYYWASESVGQDGINIRAWGNGIGIYSYSGGTQEASTSSNFDVPDGTHCAVVSYMDSDNTVHAHVYNRETEEELGSTTLDGANVTSHNGSWVHLYTGSSSDYPYVDDPGSYSSNPYSGYPPAVTWVDDYSHGDINNYGGTVLYGNPKSNFSIHQNGTAVNDNGWCLELANLSTRGGVSTMPSEGLIQTYPDVGDSFRWTGYVDSFYTGDGGDHIFMGFGHNTIDDQDNCIFVRFRGNGRYIDIMEGWGNTIAEEEVWTIGNEPSGGKFWFDINWTSGTVSVDFHTHANGYETTISADYSASKGQGVSWCGDQAAWNEALHLGAEML